MRSVDVHHSGIVHNYSGTTVCVHKGLFSKHIICHVAHGYMSYDQYARVQCTRFSFIFNGDTCLEYHTNQLDDEQAHDKLWALITEKDFTKCMNLAFSNMMSRISPDVFGVILSGIYCDGQERGKEILRYSIKELLQVY